MSDWWAGIDRLPARRWLIPALLLMALLYGYAVWNNQSTILADGRRAFWLHDDMMISMRYGRNLAEGYGLVWNPGERPVEGYSNFGWVLVMAAVHLLPLPDTLTSLVMLVTNILLAGVVLVLMVRLAERLVPRPGVWLAAGLATLVVVVDLGRWTTIGLETPLLTAVFLWLLLRVLAEAEGGRPQASTFVMAGVLGLIRVDGPLWAAVLCFVALGLQADRRRVLAYSLLVLALPAVHVVGRLAYYGYPLPNTYYLKLAGWDERLGPGLGYLLNFLNPYVILAAAAGLGAVRAGDRRVWLLLAAGGLPAAYAVFTGGDDFGGSRFFAPWLPVLLVLAFLTPHWLGWRERPLRAGALAGFMALSTGLLAGYDFFQGPGDELFLTKAGVFLEEWSEPDTPVGVFWAGTLPYFAHRPAVDMLGKNDAYVARLPANEGSLKPGHNKFDYDYSLVEQRPALLVSSMSLSVAADPERFAALTEGSDAFSGQLFLDATFQRAYAPTLWMIDSLPVFIRSDWPGRERLPAGAVCEGVENEGLRRFGLEVVCWVEV
jgi:hypothetical protein